jgi:hypothetical protein
MPRRGTTEVVCSAPVALLSLGHRATAIKSHVTNDDSRTSRDRKRGNRSLLNPRAHARSCMYGRVPRVCVTGMTGTTCFASCGSRGGREGDFGCTAAYGTPGSGRL